VAVRDISSAQTDVAVSVVFTAYNHEAYVRQALESVLAQELDEGVEILVTEDCSTDRTRQIVSEYARRHPTVIRLLLSEQNLCSNEVWLRAFRVARGRYIALLEGDDFWTYRFKLQRQVAFLDSHPGHSLCFHDAWMLHEVGKRLPHRRNQRDPNVTLERLIGDNPISTASVMLRTSVCQALPGWYAEAVLGDWELWVLAAMAGEVGFLGEIMATWRIHPRGYWTGRHAADQLRIVLAFYDELFQHMDPRFHATILTQRHKYFVSQAVEGAGVPADGFVLIASGGDDSFLSICGRYSEHFPRTPAYVHEAVDASETDRLVAHLDEGRGAGATHLVVPAAERPWFDRATGLARHLETVGTRLHDDDKCVIIKLQPVLQQPDDPARRDTLAPADHVRTMDRSEEK
jgi:glycosyltransferase involved in cell wall biosynthesis